MGGAAKNEAFHQRLALLIGTEEPFRWAKRIGIPAGTFDRMWNKYDIPKHDHLCRIARGCNVSLDWLLLGEEGAGHGDYGVLPVIGLANCGIAQGWFNETAPDSSVLLPSFMVGENAFAVVCRGRSMVPAGIKDGNICVIRPDRPVESGKPALIRMENVLDVKVPESAIGDKTALDKDALVQSLEALRPLFAHLDSEKFAQTVLSVYDEVRKTGAVSPSALGKILKIGAEKLGK